MTATATALPGAVAEALDRVAAMSLTPGATLSEARCEAFNLATAMPLPFGPGPFRLLAAMIVTGSRKAPPGEFDPHDGRLDHALIFARGNDWLADRLGVDERNVRRGLAELREAGFIRAVEYGRLDGEDRRVGAWLFTTPLSDSPDLYDLAALWFRDKGSTATTLRRRDLVNELVRAYGEQAAFAVPDYLPPTVQTEADVAGFVDHLRRAART